MNSRAYQWNILWRFTLLFVDMLAFSFALQQEQWYVTTAITGLMMPVLGYGVVSYMNRYRRQVRDFLLTIRQKDYQTYYKQNPEGQKNPGDLDHAFHTITSELQNVRIDKEAHYHHLREVVEHLESGVISYKEEGEIHLLNQAARNMLQMPIIERFRRLKRYHPRLYEEIIHLKPGERKVVHLPVKGQNLSLAIRVNTFMLQKQLFTLVSLQDIRAELEARELESWQSLIRLLRHEIMNSATPISSLSEAAKDSLEEILQKTEDVPEELHGELKDLQLSMNTIHTRTQGLLKFVQTYRKLTGVPEPTPESVDIAGLTRHVLHLFREEMERKEIELITRIPGDPIEIQVDPEQVEQVEINIVINAIDALAGCQQPTIEVRLEKRKGSGVVLSIADNGEGIQEESLQKIFMPFYSTRENGSGIGLSLARQIMKKHHGEVRVHSTPGKGTTCELYFP